MMVKMNWLVLAVCMLFVTVGNVKAEDQVIAKGKKVKFDYTLTVDGQVADTSDERGPLEYVHGQEMIIKGLESQLEGLKVGDQKTVVISAEDGYGAVDAEAILDLPKTSLDPAVVPEKGVELELQGKDGQTIPGIIEAVGEETVTVNFNHPLAGKELKFDVKIVGIE
jgi:FKBP-type peptidyl-prolyl cis-trans isomerase 2